MLNQLLKKSDVSIHLSNTVGAISVVARVLLSDQQALKKV